MPATKEPALADSPRRCRFCNNPMEQGRVMGPSPAAAMQLNQPHTIGWLPSSKGPHGRGAMDQENAEPLAELLMGWAWSKRIRFPGWRCSNCRAVEFSYAEDGR
jgi:hypothetical protein